MPPAQPSCLLHPDTLHSWLTYVFVIRTFLENHLGKEKKTITIWHTLNISSARISSAPYKAWKEGVFTQNQFTSLYAPQKGSQKTPTKASKDHSKTHPVVYCVEGMLSRGWRCRAFPFVYQTPQNICWSSRHYFGISGSFYVGYNSCSSKKKKSQFVHVKLQVTNSRDSFST